MPCATFHSDVYCSGPRSILSTQRGITRLSITSKMMSPLAVPPYPLRDAVVVAARQALEAPRRVLKPAHAADVGVEPRVAVGDDVEAGALLIAEVGADRVGVLLAEARVGERVAERAASPRFSVYQAGRGSDPVMVAGSVNSFVALSIGNYYIVFCLRMYDAPIRFRWPVWRWRSASAAGDAAPGGARGAAVAAERSRLLAAGRRFVRSRRLLPIRQPDVERAAVPARDSRSCSSARRPGGVYLGVGPEQNFTYMAALRPAMAVIFDIRRGNMLVQLMYKALFELAEGSRRVRVDAVLEAAAARRSAPTRRPPTLFSAFGSRAEATRRCTRGTSRRFETRLTRTHGLPLVAEGSRRASNTRTARSSRAAIAIRYSPTYAELMTQTDGAGVAAQLPGVARRASRS